jgi:hypothetical protein
LVTLRAYPIEIVVSELEKEVKLHPQLLFAMILQRWGEGDTDKESETYGEHLVFKRRRSDLLTEKVIIIKNPSNNQPVLDSTYGKLLAAVRYV